MWYNSGSGLQMNTRKDPYHSGAGYIDFIRSYTEWRKQYQDWWRSYRDFTRSYTEWRKQYQDWLTVTKKRPPGAGLT